MHNKKAVFVSFNKMGYFCLEKILKSGLINISHLFTIKKRLAGKISDYKNFSGLCKKWKIKIKYIKNINDHVEKIKKINPDIIFIIGWSQLINKEIINIPKLGCVGSHPALLPKNRGRAVIAWHFINEDKFGGITLFYINDGCDSGDIIGQKKFAIKKDDNALTYYKKVIKLAIKILDEQLPKMVKGTAKRKKQDHKMATYLTKRVPEDSFLNFEKMKTKEIFNQIRAVAYVYPTAFMFYNKDKIIVYKSKIITKKLEKHPAVPGQIIKIFKNAVWAKTMDGIIELQINYKKPLKVGNHFN
ncbi:MAG: methionyl-tRNA formyltransferase [Patescibacteria group bacterium]